MNKKNAEPYLSRYLHNKGARLGLPVGGNFELTARCNFSCPMCYVHTAENDRCSLSKELTAEQWIELARQAKDQGLVFALLTGGEPFVRKDFFEIYGAMRRMGLVLSINSNGSMLSGQIREQLLADPPARINVSLYGGCAETYRNMCGQDMFHQVVENIRALREAGVEVCLNLSITPYNCQDIEKIFSISRELNVHVRTSSYMYPSIRVNGGQYGCNNRLSPEAAAGYSVQWDRLRFSREEFARRAKNLHALQAAEAPECAVETQDGVSCRAGSSSFWITWDGRMLPCGMMPYPVVHPLETGFDSAWQTLRQETKKITAPAQCGSCAKKDVCGVCAAVRVTETGRFDQVPGYMCQWTDAMIEKTWEAYLERDEENGH